MVHFFFSITKIDNHDVISLPGYKFLSQNRKQKYVRKSGGIGIFVKDSIMQYISLVESDSDYILWFKLCKAYTQTDEDLFFGIVYLPPAESRFNNKDELDLFEVEITNMCVLHKYIFLMGDFNARTQTKKDYIDPDDVTDQLPGYDDLMDHFLDIQFLLSKHNLNQSRVSKDKSSNNEGNLLVEICKCNNLLILNGRCGTDKGIGEFTFRNASVIDYSIASAHALKLVKDFNINDLDCIYSDGHSLLTTIINVTQVSDKLTKAQKPTKQRQNPRWQNNRKHDFLSNIDHDKLSEIKTTVQNMHSSVNYVDSDKINSLCNDIGQVFQNAAEQSFPPVKPASSGRKPNSKNWFGYQCENARRKYHKARKRNKKRPTDSNKLNLKNASKAYKKTMNFHINKHNKSTQEKLRNLKSKNPRDFWRIMNSLDKSKDNENIDIETLYDFFKNLNEQNEREDMSPNVNIDLNDEDELLNSPITENEILKCIRWLKNNKSSSNDKIINEYLKCTADIMVPIYVSFFNIVLQTGIIPDSWIEGIIRPIYKNNGDPSNPENYRPITILSCFGKLFTAVLNLRLTNYLKHNDILEENQAGFRAGYSTSDHIFTLHVLTEILKSKRKRLYCSFIDFSKAFDSVWRVGLWTKMLKNGINGIFFRVIYNLYQNIKSCIAYSGSQSSFFQSYCGVRQGENLSPALFSLFLNDLENHLTSHHCKGIPLDYEDDDISMYLEILILLYADDTVIFGTDPNSFQGNLNAFYEYCKLWKLQINFNKTKIMVFGMRNTDNLHFKIGENDISICKEFKYLGVTFSQSRSFYKSIKLNVEKAKRALHLLYKRINNLHIPIDLQVQLFNHTILPILLYGCEIWGFHNTNLIENVQNQFLRSITKLRKSTPIYMVYAELGITPIDVHVKSRMIGFWISVLNKENTRLSKLMYNIMLKESKQGIRFKWINHIKEILISIGRPEMLDLKIINNPKAVKGNITKTLHDLSIQEWNAKLSESSKGRNYNVFKEQIEFESYLRLLPRQLYIPLIKFRTSNHRLPVEVGRWNGTHYTDRKCTLCDKNDLGDEFHYLLTCPYFLTERCNLLKPYFYKRPNIVKFKSLLSSTNRKVLANLSKFVTIIMNNFT